MASIFEQLNGALAGVLDNVAASVVQVRDESRGAGAGTIWHADGLIITNAHVVQHGPLKVALHDGRVLNARVIARDDQRDLAALSIDARDLPTIQVGSARHLQPGQWVMAVGHPWGVTNAATEGVLIGVGHQTELPGVHHDWIVADLHLRPGNSGGPLVDINGRMIGVNTLMTGPGVGVAVSVDSVKEFLKGALGSSVAETVAPKASEFV
ncbi:MAG TPA: trypsin-like peptidase domain-containing protein [Phototrophicaceae bacterium]|nr:trypsin-like peptidase domain-containing protein [Phototrophicaceae bacterium]